MDNRIDATLGALKESGQTAVVPFITIGFPDLALSERLAETILNAGGDMLELGVPFSDPLADGPTIQMTSFQALKKGANVNASLDVVRRLREKGVNSPLIFMGYFNPFLRYGLRRFVADAAEAGLDGIIVPDLPTEESEGLRTLCETFGIYLIPLLAPTSADRRIAAACKHAKGFIYCVSLAGVTGARLGIAPGLRELVGRIGRHTDLPVLVGFGVSRRKDVEEIGRFAAGVVVGSALMDVVDKSPPERVLETARDFVEGLKTSGSKRR